MQSHTLNRSTQEVILEHLQKCDHLFVPSLSETVDLGSYSSKIYDRAQRVEVWDNEVLIGLIAVYLNQEEGKSFITNVSLMEEYLGMGIAGKMLNRCFDLLKEQSIESVELEVKKANHRAIKFYNKYSFIKSRESESSLFLIRNLLSS